MLSQINPSQLKKNSTVLNNAVLNNSVLSLVYNDQNYNMEMNVRVHPKLKTTNQKSSGRCWIFAALNMLRANFVEKYKLPSDFEFSQSYLLFWDKVERYNYDLDAVYRNKDLSIDSRLVAHLLSAKGDGGQWQMVVNLIKKYGLVPKMCYNESHHSSSTHEMNKILQRLYRIYALKVRNAESYGEYDKLRQEFNQQCYELLCGFLGTPPDTFDWIYTNKNDEYKEYNDLTPMQFFRDFVNVDLDEYVCVIHDPRAGHSYNALYTVSYLTEMVGGDDVLYLNLPLDDIKQKLVASLKDNQPVWFGSDVSKYKNSRSDILDVDLLNYDELLNVDSTMTKEEELLSGNSLPSHAMVFSGCRLDKDGNPSKWLVENSWGSGSGKLDGGLVMSDAWFNQYCYHFVVKKKYLSDDELHVLAERIVTVLEPWDPYGTLASQ